MLKSLAHRLVWAVPIVLIVTFFVFALLELAPGDAATTIAGEAEPEVVAAIRERPTWTSP